MCQLDKLHQMRKEILKIAHTHKANRIFVFGSCARKEETGNSDIDFVADFQSGATLFNHAGLELDLSDLLGCSVDVVSLKRIQGNDTFSSKAKQEMLEIC